MAKKIHLLSDREVRNLNKQGSFPDGNGLYLQVSNTGSKAWFYRYQINHKGRKHGLGAYPTVTLKSARLRAEDCRKLRSDGIDPIEHKRKKDADKILEDAKAVTFKDCALLYIESHKNGWKNRKHESQWSNTMKTYAYPFIGDIAVQKIDVGLVMQVIEPIWHEKTETASRVRQRIEKVLDWAKVRQYRNGDNPARWRGHIENLLPKRSKVQKVQHFKAMPYGDVPDYFKILRIVETITAKALAFIILTATRNNEVREAKWHEIDIDAGIWIIPEERMKAEREHRVPLTQECLAILEEAKKLKVNDYIFPGLRKNKPLSNQALLKLLKTKHPTLTVHGFRSSFRDWCAEMTAYPREVAEAALAHSLSNATEAAYQRGDLLAKRFKLMNAWSDYCITDKTESEVIPINKTAS